MTRRSGIAAATALTALVACLLWSPVAQAAWTAPANVSAAGDPTTNPTPQVAVDADGDAVFVWQRFDGANNRIQARARSAAGMLGPFHNLSAPGEDAHSPQVAIDDEGDAVFVWLRNDGASDIVQTRARAANGTLSAVQSLSAAGQNSFQPQVDVDADGDAVFTWVRFNFPSFQIQTRARTAAGVLSSVQNLSATGQHAFLPQVGVDDDGDAVFIWRRSDGTDFLAQGRARSAAGVRGEIFTLSAPGQSVNEPLVEVDADGDAVFAWARFDGTVGRIQTRARSAAGVISDTQTLSEAGKSAQEGRLAVDSEGDAVYAWLLFDGADLRVQTRGRASTGSLSPAKTLSAAGESAERPDVDVDADGDGVVVWQRFNGFHRIIQARTRSRTNILGQVADLSLVESNALSPKVGLDFTGDAVATWYRNDRSNPPTGCCERVQAAAGP